MLEFLAGKKAMALAVVAAVPLSGAKILEALIIAGITAAATGYIAVKVLDERMTHLDQRMTRLERATDEQARDIREELRRIYGLLLENRPFGRTQR